MRIRVQSNVPDAWVIGAIVLAGAAIVLVITVLRLGSIEPRPAAPLDAPTLAPTALPSAAPASAPTAGTATFEPTSAPLRTIAPTQTGLPIESTIPAKKTPDLPPPGYRLGEQD